MKEFTFLPTILLIILVPLCSISSKAQTKYRLESGKIDFVSEAQLELIKASSNKIQGILDPATNQFAFTIDINSFQGFNSALQREHFNEKYLESEVYPKAKFSGKIIEQIDFTRDGVYDVRAKGDLEIHGQKQMRILKSKLTIKNGELLINSTFRVPLSDHNISIPSIVSQKIATEIEVQFAATLKAQ